MRISLRLAIPALLCLLLPALAAAQAGTGKALVQLQLSETAGRAAAERDLLLVAELPAGDGYLAFLDAADRASLGAQVRVLDALDDGSREYLIQFEHADGAHAALPDPRGLRVLHEGTNYRVVSLPAGELAATPSCLPDVMRVFRRPLRFVRSPWAEPAPLRDVDPVIVDMVAGVAQSELEATVQTLQDFGTRHSQYAGGATASQWIRDQFLSYGYTDVSFHDYNSWNDNVVCVKPGMVYPDRYVVIGGHYDSINYSDYTNAPGADDNATGTTGVLQAAKAFADHPFEYSTIFIAFSGEEQGLVGSDAWAADAAAAGMDIVGMLNLDMLCYRASGDAEDLDIISNTSSTPLADLAYATIATYVPELAAVEGYLTSGSSDHASFWGNGYRAIFFFEDSNAYSPYIHTASDVVGTSANNFGFMLKNVRAAVATLGAMARPFHIAIQHTPLGHSEGLGPFAVSALIQATEPLDAPALQLHYRVNGGSFAGVPLSPTGQPDEYGATIPGQAPGSLIEYYLSAADQAGYSATAPDGAPAETYGFRNGVTPVLRDDVEADLGWTLGAPGDNATTGLWIRADPVGTSYQPEFDHTPDPGSICFVTGNGAPGGNAGDEDVDGGQTTLLSPIFDLAGATWAGLSYWRWYTDETSHDDDFVVDISNNGGLTWTTLEIVGDSAYPWVKAEFDDLAAILPLTDQMRLRFIASDTGSGSLVEALIDDLEIVAVTGDLTAADPTTPLPTAAIAAYPNPFNPKTRLRLSLPTAGHAELAIVDAQGAHVATLLQAHASAGPLELLWDATGQPSGLYFARLSVDGRPVATQKLTLLK